MINYNMQSDYEIIAKHCPRCEALVMAAVVRTVQGEFYKYRDLKCSRCDWNSAVTAIKNS
ncbi:MAG: hypothetical protein EPN93_04020 [Spirochaetes bacterium]|nr:MAG: hypothetical protein EPN93_04020 [Spirochaetota bacterium]